MRSALTVGMTVVLTVTLGCQKGVHGGNLSKEESVPATRSGSSPDQPAGLVVGGAAGKDDHAGENDCGPTILLSYGQERVAENPICAFLYFIPLVSPVPVNRHVPPQNQQHAGIISYEKKVNSRSFSVTSEFEMAGQGGCRYTFEPAEMIALRVAESKKKGEPLAHLLDYINFEGEGFGVIHIKGTVVDGVENVTEVELEFNARGHKSPALIGLYDLKPKDGRYRYENRSNEIVARVNSLAFKRSESPRMGITVASISNKAGDDGLLGQIKAALANLFLKPARIDPVGNEALLDFGHALCEQKPTFTFPKAAKMKDVTVLAAESVQEQRRPASAGRALGLESPNLSQ